MVNFISQKKLYMRLLIAFILLTFLLVPSASIKAQPTTDDITVLEMVVIDGDTFPMYTFKSITVNGSRRFSKRAKRKYGRLKRYVVKVYPYAELAGEMLNKLIDRETGNSSFELIKTLRGSFSAFIWQSLARLFGSNLKLKYDPEGEDLLVEEIVLQMESGAIPYQKRVRKKKVD